MTPRDARAIQLGTAAILGALIVLRGAPAAVRGVAWLHQRAIAQADVAARSRALLAASPATQDSLSGVLRGIVGLAPTLVDGHSAAEAAASLSGMVSHAANRHALKVLRLDPLPDSTAGVFSRVSVHAELEGDVAGAARLLRAIERGAPLLSVTALAVSATDPWSRPGTGEVLRVEMDVTGFYLPRATP
ncbi:MAG: type II secretion system protein GspM [Gemmatimonadales bacterium]